MVLYLILLTVWAIVQIFLIAWVYRVQPPKHLLNKYPKKVKFLSRLPIGSGWKKKVDKEDLKGLEIFQRRLRIMYLSMIIPLFILKAYILVDLNLTIHNLNEEMENLKETKEKMSYVNQ